MRRLSLSRRFPFFWKGRASIQDEESKPLVPKDTCQTRAASSVTFLGTDDSSESKTGSSSSSHELQSRMFLVPQAHTRSSLADCVLKFILFSSNLLFTVLGLATLGLGLWGLFNKESFAQEKLGSIGTDPMLLFVFLGLVLSLLCLTGCVGAVRENCCLLRTFSATLLALVAIQVLVAIVAYTLQGRIPDLLRTGMLTAMVRYQDDLDLRFITDEIQTGLQCCGADNYRDWQINSYFNCSAPGVQACSVPPSCCVDPLENGTVWNSQCGVGAQLLDEFSVQSVIYLGGCLGGISRWIEQHSGVIGTVVIILLGVQFITLIIATRLLDKIQWNKAQARQEALRT